MTKNDLANLIFPELEHDFSYYENLYKPRNEETIVRFAPSPTGFLHTGSLYTALINYKLAHDHNGIFYLRIEDTDTKRTVEGSMETLKNQLEYFGIKYQNDEAYGPYLQSERKDIYNACLKKLLLEDKIYPCFMNEEELSALRNKQEEAKERTGVYGKYAIYRDLSVDEQIEKIKNNIPYVLRLKSNGNFNHKFKFHDLLHGTIELPENDFDIVVRKNDGLPTYHFAHAVDDHFMGTTKVIRGEEWLTSAPIHVELFNTLGFKLPEYLHLDSIMKQENGNKRKLSKRKDPEASVTYLMELGYPKEAIINYLLSLANSNYEEYFMNSKNNDTQGFSLEVSKMSKTGALFDIDKLNSVSKETISFMEIDHLVESIREYAKNNNHDLIKCIDNDVQKFKAIMSIGRNDANPRKEYQKYNEVFDKIKFFYNEYFDQMDILLNYDLDITSKVIDSFKNISFEQPEALWLDQIKESSKKLGFAKNKKEKETLGLSYMFSDYMRIIRNLICKSDASPSIYDCLNILGHEEVMRRLMIK